MLLDHWFTYYQLPYMLVELYQMKHLENTTKLKGNGNLVYRGWPYIKKFKRLTDPKYLELKYGHEFDRINALL